MLKAMLCVMPESRIRVYDFEVDFPPAPGSRIAVVAIDDQLDLSLGIYDDDDRIAACGLLIDALETVRLAAMERLAESIRVKVADMAPGELAEMYGR